MVQEGTLAVRTKPDTVVLPRKGGRKASVGSETVSLSREKLSHSPALPPRCSVKCQAAGGKEGAFRGVASGCRGTRGPGLCTGPGRGLWWEVPLWLLTHPK